MEWKQASPMRWERATSGMEEYFIFTGNITAALYDGRQQYTVISTVKAEFNNIPDVESALRHAWKQVRYEEPDIATTVELGKKIFEVLDDAGVEKWADQTFIIDRDNRDADALHKNPRRMKPSTLYYLPKSSELVLHAHHATVDGVGMVVFWDRFFRAVTSPNREISFGQEHARLVPAIDDLIGPQGPPTPEGIEVGKAMVMDYVGNLPAIGFPSRVGKVPAGESIHMEKVFAEETTSAIVKGCKAKGISVTTAVHAAYITILSKYADPETNTTKYTTPCEFNIRGRLPAPYNMAAASQYYIPLPFSLDLPATFPQMVAILNKYYRTTIDAHPDWVENQGYFTRALEQFVKTPEYRTAPIPTDGLVSSLGIVEKHLQRSYGEGDAVVVRDWKLSCDCVLGMTGFHVYTFRDKLRFVFQFNEAYQEPKDIRFYMEEIERVLTEEIIGTTNL
ncbi:hypothetical protein BJY01DRAFT_219067 [Aspergillus pseudoustus]|uniref:Condensation domain-containing protein n=1 Tax=Aspergillus pseudoustus TaxID=1810923 RepID=A0ABR4JIL6_9EURO